MDIIWFSAFVATSYAASVKTFRTSTVFFLNVLSIIAYLFVSSYLCSYLDTEDYVNRTRAAEVLDEETVERLESFVRSEEVENTREISVNTDDLIRRYNAV